MKSAAGGCLSPTRSQRQDNVGSIEARGGGGVCVLSLSSIFHPDIFVFFWGFSFCRVLETSHAMNSVDIVLWSWGSLGQFVSKDSKWAATTWDISVVIVWKQLHSIINHITHLTLFFIGCFYCCTSSWAEPAEHSRVVGVLITADQRKPLLAESRQSELFLILGLLISVRREIRPACQEILLLENLCSCRSVYVQ